MTGRLSDKTGNSPESVAAGTDTGPAPSATPALPAGTSDTRAEPEAPPPFTADGLPRRRPGAHVAAQLRDSADNVPGPVSTDDTHERTPEQIAAQFAGFPSYADPDAETYP